ncbi:rod shape-determining protein [Oleiharenicola lentus]|uniref:rod shape-determining protein n=1 Tax=Oleiharenicola lentus TaxID=2508720 RepID=UPI003F666CCF
MTTTTLEKKSDPLTPVQPVNAARPAEAPTTTRKTGDRKKIFVGFDLGTNASCVLAGPADSRDTTVSKVIPTLVGYAREGLVDGIIANNATTLIGEDALNHRLQLRVIPPLEDGIIANRDAAKDFIKRVRAVIDPTHSAEIRAVIGVPANAGNEAREDIRTCAAGVFDRVLLIPEPFLAALGFRDDSRLGQANYVDPVTNSLFIDIGGGTSDLCLIQGYFPTPEDQISLAYAGDAVDKLIEDDLQRTYPNNGLSRATVRQIKEEHSYVGPIRKPIDVKVLIGGKSYTIELGETIGRACNRLLEKIYPALTTLISRASSESVAQLLQNIVVTGGGSRIRGFDTVLQQKLQEDGFEAPKVRLAGTDYKRFVAVGALKAARGAREDQWQHLLS